MPHGAIPFPFGKCRICSDKATGVHYGVATCEGCKGFYKRSIPKGEKYRCYFGGTCVITPENRNRCKSCRFRKCLEQGMAVEAVKMGRIPKVEKERALEEVATFKKDVEEGGCMSPPSSNVTGVPPPKQITTNSNTERGKRPATSSLPFDGDLGCPPWERPHGDSAQNSYRYPHPHKKFITEFPFKEDAIKVEASDSYFSDKGFHPSGHPHPMQPLGTFNNMQTASAGLPFPDRSAMSGQVSFPHPGHNNSGGHHHGMSDQAFDDKRMFQGENGFHGPGSNDMFRVDSGVFLSHGSANFPSAHSNNSSSMFEQDSGSFANPRESAFQCSGSRSSSTHSSDTSSGFSSHGSLSADETSGMSLDWYRRGSAAARDDKPLLLPPESHLGPFEKLMIASEAARNHSMECQNSPAVSKDRDGSPHESEFSTPAGHSGMSGEMDGGRPGTEGREYMASPGASPVLQRSAVASPNNSGNSSPEGGSRNLSKSCSPGLIKVLFHQVMQGENGEQRDKLLKKLARTCSEEALGSSGLELLHSVVSSSMANRRATKTASSPDIRTAVAQASSGQSSNFSPSLTPMAVPSPSLGASSPAVSHNSFAMSSHGSHEDFNLDSFDAGSSLFSQQPGFRGEGGGGLHPAPQGGPLDDRQQQWGQTSPPYPRGEQGSHPAQYAHCHAPSDSLAQSHNQSFMKEFFPATHSFPAADMGHSHDGQHSHLPPSSQHSSPSLGYPQSHPEQTFSSGMEGGTTIAGNFQSMDSHFSVPTPDNTACTFDLNYLCSEQLRDIHEAHTLSDTNSPASSHEGSQVNLTAGYGEHPMKDFGVTGQVHAKNGMSLDGQQCRETLDPECFDSPKESAVPAYFSDPHMKEAALVLGSGKYKIFECEKKRSLRDGFLRRMREDPTITPPTVEKAADIYPLLMKSLPDLNKKIISFCQTAPGFANLDAADQKTLLKRAYYDIWMLTSSEYFVDGESYLVVQDDPIFYIRRDMEKIIGLENTKTIHCFSQQFNALLLSDLEIAILCCIQLTAPAHDQQADLKDVREIQKLNSFYLDLLVAVVTDIHGDSCSRVLIDIFRLVPLLTEINRLQRELIGNFSVRGPPGLEESQAAQAEVKQETG